MTLLKQIMKLEETYLMLQTTAKSPHGVNFVIETNLKYLKTHIANLENNRIANLQKVDLLMNYLQNVERFTIFERIDEKTNKILFKILKGTTELLKIYIVGTHDILMKKNSRKVRCMKK